MSDIYAENHQKDGPPPQALATVTLTVYEDDGPADVILDWHDALTEHPKEVRERLRVKLQKAIVELDLM